MLARCNSTASSRAALEKALEKAVFTAEEPMFWHNLEYAVKLIDPIVEAVTEFEADKCPTSQMRALFRRLRTLDLYDKDNRAGHDNEQT
ncbi:hypothetical protein ON010_g7215 [Phytophthora cinnamomi]|nr:hypothetical protein ON010_g7215 [Phytophthora cinnamomi]